MISKTGTGSADAIAELNRLLSLLEANLAEARLTLKQQEEALAQVKVFGRNKTIAGPIFEKRGISLLSRYGFDREAVDNTSREALRCLANALLLNESCRQIFVDLDYASKTANRLKLDNPDDEFLAARILFLLTYDTGLNFETLIASNDVADSINQHIVRHAKNFASSGRKRSTNSQMEDMAMCETLKLLFNITYYYPDQTDKFAASIQPMIHILLHHSLPEPPLQPPTSYLLNALLNLNLEAAGNTSPMGRDTHSSPVFPNSNPESVVNRLISILDTAIKKQPEAELDQAAASLCTLLRRVHELASPQIQSFMTQLLLPTDSDRSKPLGHGELLSARLLRLSCSPHLPTLRGNISALLFELSDKDASKFIQNVGYGFASGFLMSQNIEIPADAVDAGRTNHAGGAGARADVNPITGQKWTAQDREHTNTAEMAQEEKEREAERLFVLFERLKATGVVDVKNPVQQAIDEGRFEELD